MQPLHLVEKEINLYFKNLKEEVSKLCPNTEF